MRGASGELSLSLQSTRKPRRPGMPSEILGETIPVVLRNVEAVDASVRDAS
jgi:hypothetical protein